MRHLLLGTVATVAILVAPTGAFAQSQSVQGQGQQQAAVGGERAKIDAMLDQAAMPNKSETAGQQAAAAPDGKAQPAESAASKTEHPAPAPAATAAADPVDAAPDAATSRAPEKSAARADDQDKSTASAERTAATRDAAPRTTAQQTSAETKGDRLAARDDKTVSESKPGRAAEVERPRVRAAANRVDVEAGRSRADRRVDVEASDRVRSVGPRRADRRVDVAASVRDDRAEPRRAVRQRVARETPRGARSDDRRRFDDQRVADRMEAPRMTEDRRSARRFVEAAPNPGAARIIEMGDGHVLIVRPRIAYRSYRVVTVVED